MNLPFFHVDGSTAATGRQEEIGLPGQKRRYLDEIAHLRGPGRCVLLRERPSSRQSGAFLDGGQRLQPFAQTRSTERGAEVRLALSKDGLEYLPHVHAVGARPACQPRRDVQRQIVRLESHRDRVST